MVEAGGSGAVGDAGHAAPGVTDVGRVGHTERAEGVRRNASPRERAVCPSARPSWFCENPVGVDEVTGNAGLLMSVASLWFSWIETWF